LVFWFSDPFGRESATGNLSAFTLNHYWLDEYHLDGFRYDDVPGMFDGGVGQGYAALTYNTYQISKPIPRFQDPARFSRIIQCAEHLPEPQHILKETYSNCCRQNNLMDKAADSAYWGYADPALALLLDPGFQGYPAPTTIPARGSSSRNRCSRSSPR
jgi:1,4-alpha-glucan branching enzyme